MELDSRTLSQLIMNAALRMAADGVPATIPRQLDYDNPVIPLAIDIDDDVALATLLSWSEQDYGYQPALCNAALVRLEDGRWSLTNHSSGVPPSVYPLSDRRPASREGLHIRLYERSGNEQKDTDGPQHGSRLRKRWVAAAIQVTSQVHALRIGDRQRAIPFHGYVPIAVRDPATAVVTSIGDDGSALETIDLRRGSSELFSELRHRDPDAWPFKISYP